MFKLINICKPLLVGFYLTASVVNADTLFDFRGVELGMSSSQINSLESVKEGYMPRVELLPKDTAKNSAICKPASVSVVFERGTYSFRLTDYSAPKEGIAGDKRNRSYYRPDTVICDTERSQNFKNAAFSVKLVFWDGVLQQFEIWYDAGQEKFHTAILDKFIEGDDIEILSNNVTDDIKRYYVTPGGTGFSMPGNSNFNADTQPTAFINIVHKYKIRFLDKFLINNYPQFVRLTVEPYGFRRTIQQHGEKEFQDYIDSLAAEEDALRLKAREKIKKKQELDKKFMN